MELRDDLTKEEKEEVKKLEENWGTTTIQTTSCYYPDYLCKKNKIEQKWYNAKYFLNKWKLKKLKSLLQYH